MATTKPPLAPPIAKKKSLKGRSQELVQRLAEVAKENDPAKEKAYQESEEKRAREQADIYAAFHKKKK